MSGKEIGELIIPEQFDYFTVSDDEIEFTASGSKSKYAWKDIRWYGSNFPFTFPGVPCDQMWLVRKGGILLAFTAGGKRLLRAKKLLLQSLFFVLYIILLIFSKMLR